MLRTLQMHLQSKLTAGTRHRLLDGQLSSSGSRFVSGLCRLHRLQAAPCGKLRHRQYCTAFEAQAAIAEAQQQTPDTRQKNITWDSLGFGLDHVAPNMYVAEWSPQAGWLGNLKPYGPLQMMPSAQVLNYGQSIFEGMKAQRTPQGTIVLFRPDQNAARMQAGAARLSMPPPPEELFLAAVQELVASNADYVPPHGRGSLYIRPLLMGSGAILGLGPAPSYTFAVYAAAVGAYFKEGYKTLFAADHAAAVMLGFQEGGQLTPIDLVVEERFHRAAPGGMGGTKAAGNYSPVLNCQLAAKKEGYADVVYLDAKSDTYLEEVSSCNIFTVKGNTVKTPTLQGTILPGVTRKSVLELACDLGFTAEEAPITIEEAMQADEVFTTGTAVVLSPVGSLTYKGSKKVFGKPGAGGEVAMKLYDALTSIQQGRREDKFGWVVPVKEGNTK